MGTATIPSMGMGTVTDMDMGMIMITVMLTGMIMDMDIHTSLTAMVKSTYK